jgi:hypothetical protein
LALLAEELVEEWLNRKGYFTIRGAKIGVHEIDLLAIRPGPNGLECRQVEVQVSVRPVSYVTPLPVAVQRSTGRKAQSAKLRSTDELRTCVGAWVHKKYEHPPKRQLRDRLAPGPWSRELVVHNVKFPDELEFLIAEGVRIHRLSDIVSELQAGQFMLDRASGESLVDLVLLTTAGVQERDT